MAASVMRPPALSVSPPLPTPLLLTALLTAMVLLAVRVTLPAFSRLTRAAGVMAPSAPVPVPVPDAGVKMATERTLLISPVAINALPAMAPLSGLLAAPWLPSQALL